MSFYNMNDWGKFHTGYIWGNGLTAESLNKAIEAIEEKTKNMRVLIVESYVEDIFEDVITNFGVVFKGNTVSEVEEYLKTELQEKYVEDNEQYYFDVYQFNAPSEPEIIERYIMNNLSLYKRIDQLDLGLDE